MDILNLKSTTYKLFLFIVLIISFSSCRHKDLIGYSSNGNNTLIKINWENAPEAEKIVRSVNVVLYNAQTGQEALEIDVENNQRYVKLAPGNYNAVAVSYNIKGHRYIELVNKENINNIFVYSTPTAKLYQIMETRFRAREAFKANSVLKTTENNITKSNNITENSLPDIPWIERVSKNSPGETDSLYVGKTLNSVVKETEEINVITIYPKYRTNTYTLIIKDIKNIESVLGLDNNFIAYLDNISKGIYIGRNWDKMFSQESTHGGFYLLSKKKYIDQKPKQYQDIIDNNILDNTQNNCLIADFTTFKVLSINNEGKLVGPLSVSLSAALQKDRVFFLENSKISQPQIIKDKNKDNHYFIVLDSIELPIVIGKTNTIVVENYERIGIKINL